MDVNVECHNANMIDLFQEELVSRISRKLKILRTEHTEIRDEIDSNEQLGHIVLERVKITAKRNELDKFKLHVEEIEKITSLLLGLSGRLARAENALMGLDINSKERVSVLGCIFTTHLLISWESLGL